MNYIDEDKGFEEWCENNYLPILSQAIWKKLFKRFNRSGWSEWVTVDNQTLMAEVQIRREATFIELRDKLLEAGLIEYIKGKKGCPNKYKLLPVPKICTFTGEVQTVVQSEVQTVVQSEVQTVDITKLDKDKTKPDDFMSCPSRQSCLSCHPEKPDRQDETDREQTAEYEALIKANIGYSRFASSKNAAFIDELVSIMLDAITSKGQYIRIGACEKNRRVVESQLLKLREAHITHVIDRFKSLEEPVRKRRQYLLSMLYNTSMELESFYEQL